MSQDFFAWVDIETFGLNEKTDPIIELGIRITNLELETLAKGSWLIWTPEHDMRLNQLKIAARDGDEGAEYVLNMHTKNGLLEQAMKNGQFTHWVEGDAISWLKGKGNDPDYSGLPMSGSSVHYDQRFIRQWMPGLLKVFHYRIIDTSTLKELCRRYNPPVYENLPTKTEQHRVNPDLDETIQEFRFYRDEFLLW